MRTGFVAGTLYALLAAGVGLAACGGDGGSADEAVDRPADVRLYLGGLGEIFVVDVESERAERIEYPALVGGDPPNLIEARGNGFALWSGSRTRFSEFDLARPPTLIGEALFFVTGAGADSVWLVERPSQGAKRLGPIREVNTPGNAVGRATRPPAGYPASAVREGLAFLQARSLAIWDARTDRVVRRIPTGAGLPGPTHGDMVTLCDYEDGAALRIASTEGGRPSPIKSPKNVVGVDCRAGEISPDGTLLAAPVTISDRPLGWLAFSKAPVALGIADLRTRRLTVVPGSRVPHDYRFARWSPDGRSAFILGRVSDGPRKDDVENRIVEYSPVTGATREIDVDLGGFYDVVTTEAAGPLPQGSYAESRRDGAAGTLGD